MFRRRYTYTRSEKDRSRDRRSPRRHLCPLLVLPERLLSLYYRCGTRPRDRSAVSVDSLNRTPASDFAFDTPLVWTPAPWAAGWRCPIR